MGAYSPVPFISDAVRDEALERIIRPVAAGLVKEGLPFTGILYGGLILTEECTEGDRVQCPFRRSGD